MSLHLYQQDKYDLFYATLHKTHRCWTVLYADLLNHKTSKLDNNVKSMDKNSLNPTGKALLIPQNSKSPNNFCEHTLYQISSTMKKKCRKQKQNPIYIHK
jgi:hypothetical protein